MERQPRGGGVALQRPPGAVSTMAWGLSLLLLAIGVGGAAAQEQQPGPCPTMKGYMAFGDMDHAQNDISCVAGVLRGAFQCNVTSQCQGFTLDLSSGQACTKSSSVPTSTRIGTCLYTKLGCDRPSGWCTGQGSSYAMLDCDGDGKLDHACMDTEGRRWTVLSSQGCMVDYTGNASASQCSAFFAGPTYRGCYRVQPNATVEQREWPLSFRAPGQKFTLQACQARALVLGHRYFALMSGGADCFTGNNANQTIHQFGPSTSCTLPCSANSSQICGGAAAVSLFDNLPTNFTIKSLFSGGRMVASHQSALSGAPVPTGTTDATNATESVTLVGTVGISPAACASTLSNWVFLTFDGSRALYWVMNAQTETFFYDTGSNINVTDRGQELGYTMAHSLATVATHNGDDRALWRLVPQSNGTFLIVNHQTNRLLLDTSSALNRNATCAGPPSSPAASQHPSLPQVVTADDNYDGRAVWRISGFHLEPVAASPSGVAAALEGEHLNGGWPSTPPYMPPMPQRVASPAQSPGAQAESNGPWSITILISTGSTMIGQVFCGEQFYNAMLQVFQGTGVGDQVDTMPICSQGDDFNGLYADMTMRSSSAVQMLLTGLGSQGYALQLLHDLQVTCGDVTMQVYNAARQDITMFKCAPDANNVPVNAAFDIQQNIVNVPQLCCPPPFPLFGFEPPSALLTAAAEGLLSS